MDNKISSKLSLSFSVKDSEALFKRAVASYIRTHYGIEADESLIQVDFKATRGYDQTDRNAHGSPEFAGAEVTITQAAPNSSRGADPFFPR